MHRVTLQAASHGRNGANAAGIRYFSGLKGGEIVDTASLDCVVGRVRGRKWNWGIVDRSDSLSRVVFIEDDEINQAASADD